MHKYRIEQNQVFFTCRHFHRFLKNFHYVSIFLFILIFFLKANCAAVVVKPDDQGTIEFPIKNDAESVGVASDVRISVDIPPNLSGNFNIVPQDTVLGPLIIQPGEVKTFIVSYQIGPNAPSGDFDVVLNVIMTNPLIYPALDTFQTHVSFLVSTACASDVDGPLVTLVNPSDGATNVTSDSKIQAVYNSALSEGDIQVSGGGISGQSLRTGATVEFVHPAPLEGDAHYHASVTGVKDQCGNAGADKAWDFTTAPFDAEITQPVKNDPQNEVWTQLPNFTAKGRIKNPDEAANVEVCAELEGTQIGCQTFALAASSGSSTWSADFGNLQDQEGNVCVKMKATYKGKTVPDQVCRKVDNKKPELSTLPDQNTNTSGSEIQLSATATDVGSGIGDLRFAQLIAVLAGVQQAASVNGTFENLVFGPNNLEASASDRAGNTTTKQIVVNRTSGAAASWTITENVKCDGPGKWTVKVRGSPGLLGSLTFAGALTNFTINSTGVEHRLFSKTAVGVYPIQLDVRTSTGQLVFSEASTLRIDPCLRYDPTFMTDPENHADNPGTSRDAGSSLRVFSPLGNGAKTFDQTYLAVYAQTDIRVTVHSLAGVLLRTLVDETQRVGESSFQWDGKNIQGILQPEGKYAVTIEARDHTAPEAVRSESIDVAIDNTRPAVNLSRIEGDPFSLRGYHLYGEISDQNADTYHVYRVAGAQATSLFTGRINSIPSTKELASIDTSEWEPGNYFLRVEAFDLGGNHTATSETSGSPDPPSMPLAVGRAASVPPHLQAKVNGQSPYSSGEESRVPDNPHVFFDDDLPAGATPVDAAQWNWSPIAYSGRYAVTIEERDHTAPEAVKSESIDVEIDNTRPPGRVYQVDGFKTA